MSEMSYRHSVSVGAAIYSSERDEFLLIRRADTGEWQLPGGVLEEDEGPLAGLAREVMEETGVTIKPVRLTGVYKNMKIGVIALVFLAEYTAGETSTSSESLAVEWHPRKSIPDLMSPAFACRLLDAVDGSAEVAIRMNDGISILQ